MSIEDRIQNLEMKISFIDDTVDVLNSEVLRQDLEIKRLNEKIIMLKSMLDEKSEPTIPVEKPPHY